MIKYKNPVKNIILLNEHKHKNYWHNISHTNTHDILQF